MNDAAFEAWVESAKAARIEDVAATVLNLKVPARGELQTACPNCGGSDRFSINAAKGVWNCRGAKGGHDAIGMIMHARDCDFLAACELITGEAPPKRESTFKPRDPQIDREKREERKDEDRARAAQEAAERERQANRAEALFGQAQPIEGTLAERYYERRGIYLGAFSTADLGFVPALAYRGFPDPDAEEETHLGDFPCILAAARDDRCVIRGVHRTYLDSEGRKLRPPGDANRNHAKKGTFRMGGASIMLQPPADGVFAIGEGVETCLSWLALAQRGEFGDEYVASGVAAAYSLGNLCGSATGSIPHPNPPRGRKNATIFNGDPDMESQAVWIPEGVRRVVILGDGDSDPSETRARLQTGAARFRRLGFEVLIHMAGPGPIDWNDALLSTMAEQKAA